VLECDFGPTRNGRTWTQAEKDADGNFWLSVARARRSNECGSNSNSRRCRWRTADDDKTGWFPEFQKYGVESVKHLKDSLRGILPNIDTSAEYFAGGIQNDELHIVALAHVADAIGHFSQHDFVEQIVVRTVERHASDAGIYGKFDELKLFGLATTGLRRNVNRMAGFHDGHSLIRTIPDSKTMLARGLRSGGTLYGVGAQ
jgi:hypothetical protein